MATWDLTPPSVLSGVGSGSLEGYLAHRPEEHDRTCRLLDYASVGSPGHGLIHLLADSALEIVFSWNSEPSLLVGFGMVSCLVGPKKRTLSVGSAVHLAMMVIFLGSAFFPLWWKSAAALSLMKQDRTRWPRCVLWHGW